jgi:hypothetical protein
MWPFVLKLDISGIPEAWINVEEAAHYYATDSVAYSYGDICARLHGGVSRATARRSFIDVHPILAVRGQCAAGKLMTAQPRLTRFNHKLFTRDRFTCAYCGGQYGPHELEREHILPFSRGGKDSWMNVVASCRDCNRRKSAYLPHEVGMSLLYAPYVPSLWEDMILRNRRILSDQMQFLAAKLPRGSRLSG